MKLQKESFVFALLLLWSASLAWSCQNAGNAIRCRDSDNWNMDIDDWEGWTVSYQPGKGYYLCQIHDRRILIIMNPDSVCFKTGAFPEYGVFSIRTSPKEREWKKAIPRLSKKELLSKASVLAHYPIVRIEQYPDSALKVVLSTGHRDALGHLMKAKKRPGDERWTHLGGHWYELSNHPDEALGEFDPIFYHVGATQTPSYKIVVFYNLEPSIIDLSCLSTQKAYEFIGEDLIRNQLYGLEAKVFSRTYHVRLAQKQY